MVPDRDTLIRRHKRDQLLLNPDADVTSGQPDMDAKLMSDTLLPIYSDASLIAQGINEDDATGPRLDRVMSRIGLTRGLARGASGYGSVSAAAGGGTLVAGTEVQNKQTKLRYEIAETVFRTDGQHVRIRGRDTGVNTDVPPGTVLTITNPPPGIGQQLVVVEQSGGRGLSGGAENESDPNALKRVRAHKQNPPGGDNDAELVETIMLTPDVAFEQVFTYRGLYGPGTTGFTATVLSPALGASRIPTDAQMQAAFDWLRAQMPGDHQYFPLVPDSSPVVLAFAVSWAIGGWTDVSPWPAAYSDGVAVTDATSATAFTLDGAGDNPIVGQTIAFWDRTRRVFQRKRLATVSGSGPWVVTCSTANGVSDTTYVPELGQLASPWSDNLAAVPTPVLTYMATLGPGEVFDPNEMPSEDGRGRVRQPEHPKAWPYKTGSRVLVDLGAIDQIQDVDDLAGVGDLATPSLPPKQLELSDLAIYAA